jgi:hypothetical protein
MLTAGRRKKHVRVRVRIYLDCFEEMRHNWQTERNIYTEVLI